MSRIGKKPVQIPAGVEVTVNDKNIAVKGAKGQLDYTFADVISVAVEENEIVVTRANEERASRALHGLTRALIHNMVVGVSEGFTKTLELVGVGYRAQLKGDELNLSLGFSHPVTYKAPAGITFECPDQTHIKISGVDKQQVGQVAAEIRGKRPPEPYKGKGVRYQDEHVRRKLGKAAK